MQISKIIEAVQKILAVVYAVVQAVESAGTAEGPEKRTEAIAMVRSIVQGLDLPDWLKGLFGSDAVLGTLVDLAVKALNRLGLFTHKEGN